MNFLKSYYLDFYFFNNILLSFLWYVISINGNLYTKHVIISDDNYINNKNIVINSDIEAFLGFQNVLRIHEMY